MTQQIIIGTIHVTNHGMYTSITIEFVDFKITQKECILTGAKQLQIYFKSPGITQKTINHGYIFL